MEKILPRLVKRESINHRKGFTLVELLVVMSIIAILAVVGITLFTNAQKSARDARRRGDIKAIQMALEQYKLANGSYPNSSGGNNWFSSCTVATITACTGGTDWITGLSSYFSSGAVPNDPINNGWYGGSSVLNPHYGYSYYSAGTEAGKWYMLVVPLENPTSADLATSCTTPSGSRFNYGGDSQYSLNIRMACNQQ